MIHLLLMVSVWSSAQGYIAPERGHELHSKLTVASGTKGPNRDVSHHHMTNEERTTEFLRLRKEIKQHTTTTGGAWAGHIPEHLVHHFASRNHDVSKDEL
jgi:hypothetical protein